MPVSGFRVGDYVRTPGHHWARVIAVHHPKGGGERVTVEYRDFTGRRTFDARALSLSGARRDR